MVVERRGRVQPSSPALQPAGASRKHQAGWFQARVRHVIHDAASSCACDLAFPPSRSSHARSGVGTEDRPREQPRVGGALRDRTAGDRAGMVVAGRRVAAGGCPKNTMKRPAVLGPLILLLLPLLLIAVNDSWIFTYAGSI